LSSTQSKH